MNELTEDRELSAMREMLRDWPRRVIYFGVVMFAIIIVCSARHAHAESGSTDKCGVKFTDHMPDPARLDEYRNSCQAGEHVDCIRWARVLIEHECSRRAGVEVLQESCNDDFLAACHGLAAYYVMNERDIPAAADLLTKACHGGLDVSCDLQGTLLERDHQSPQQSELYFNIACQRGYVPSCIHLLDSSIRRDDGEATSDYIWKACAKRVDYMCSRGLETIRSVYEVKDETLKWMRPMYLKICNEGLMQSCLTYAEYIAPRFPDDAIQALTHILASDADDEIQARAEKLLAELNRRQKSIK